MDKSITETIKKINRELNSYELVSIFITLLIISLFLIYKIKEQNKLLIKDNIIYEKSNYSFLKNNKNTIKYIYASKRGKKYYFFNCKSTIKEENKTFFNTEEEALKAGYTLSKTCK